MRISDWSSDVCSSDLIRSDQRSPSNSSAKAVPHASSYHLPCLLVSFSNVMVAFCNSMQHSQSRRFANQGQNVMPRIIFVNLPVSDIAAAMRCYDALGFTNAPRFTDETAARSEEHTYELQSIMRISYADICVNKNTQTDTH